MVDLKGIARDERMVAKKAYYEVYWLDIAMVEI